ncbi:MAG: CRTAC1 family protein [Bacteroidia bacterium]|nr:CRTAC1 family protein [Bacteroidia bacterium]
MKKLLILLILCFYAAAAFATGEASTYFEIFCPANNDAVNRHVVLVVTAIYDSTEFEIIDDGADGDTDDSVSGMLMAGQSYILYIKDGAVNDDAPARGQARGSSKQDGDFFVVKTSKLSFASQSTNSDWQHDWVPATNKSSLGTKFIVYAPTTTWSPRDLNVMAYSDSTTVSIQEIHTTTTTTTGYTEVDISNGNLLVQRMINIGEDLIYHHTDGRNIMQSGGTYLIETNKPVTVMYGALYGNSRDGGGFVPSANGSSSGELFYFSIPVQARREQEVRIVSWNDSNEVVLEKFVNGDWIGLDSWTVDELKGVEWISYSGNHNGVFRLRCSEGKTVSVFEANWLETGRPGTSDVSSMVSSRDGTTAGKAFLVYMPPPGAENNVKIPGTNDTYTYGSHAYLFSRDTAKVTVKDAFTDGQKINRTYTVVAGSYVDCYLDLGEWRSIYNGNGNPNSGPERPYLIITSDKPISVFASNFNDNWMAYFGTSQTQDFKVTGNVSQEESSPGDSVEVMGDISLTGDTLKNTRVEVIIGDGAEVVESTFKDRDEEIEIEGEVIPQENGETIIAFDSVPDLDPEKEYFTETKIIINGQKNNGDPILDQTIITVETIISGEVDSIFQQASTSNGLTISTENYSPKIFFRINNGSDLTTSLYSNLGLSFGDFNGDGFQDVFMGGYNSEDGDLLYVNNGDRTFTLIDTGAVSNTLGTSVGGTWGDADNDGDLDLFVTGIGDPGRLYINRGGGNFEELEEEDIYRYNGHNYNAAWVDYDKDGFLDIFVSDFLANRPNILFHNEGDGTFRRRENLLPEPGATIGGTWCDFDNDGDMDLFAPNGNGEDNFLYRNNGRGTFVRLTTGDLVNDGGNSVGSSWGDYDNDGDFDLYVCNSDRQQNFLYQNNGDGSFTRVLEGALVNDKDRSQGSSWGDFDNDGDLDLYVTNGQQESRKLYINNGDGSFTTDFVEPVTREGTFSLGAAHADIDNDGDLDLMVANHVDNPNQFYLNNGNENNWIQIRLVGTVSNRTAIGAQIRVKATINGEVVTQLRQIEGQSGGGASAQNSLIAHFGLGDATSIDTIEVRWPSGFTQFESNVNPNQFYEIVEDKGIELTGRIFLDADSSCSLTQGDIGIPNQKVLINPGEIVAITDSNGLYTTHLQEGTYTISQISNSAWTQLCPEENEGYEVEITEGGGVAAAVYEKSSLIEDCSWGCTKSISGNQNETLEAGEQFCIEEGNTYSGNLNINGGVLVICGTLSVQNLNLNGNNPILVVLSETGQLNVNNININNSNAAFINYALLPQNLSITGGLNVQGRIENHGRLSLSSMNINSGATVLNSGEIILQTNLNNNAELENYGSITISGGFNNNGNGIFRNYCSLEVQGNFNQNGTFHHEGYLNVTERISFNGTSDIQNTFAPGALINTRDLTVNGDLNGPNTSGLSIQVSNETNLNGGAVISGYIDICDQNGIETYNAALTDKASTDCSISIQGTPCNDGFGERRYQGFDFANRANCENPELSVSIATNDLRRGFENDYIIQVGNNGGGAASDFKLTILMNENLVPVRSTPPWDFRTKVDTNFIMEWDLSDIEPLQVQTITLTDSVDAMSELGKIVQVRASISPVSNECDTLNNSYTSFDEIVGSFDPNDKQVWPKGAGKGGYIRVSDTLLYKIRFQNVGNFFASRVVIYDTLSKFLDLSTFVPGPMSHDGSVSVSEDGIAIFRFDNIFLPDSASDEEGSQGFVTFTISPKESLVHGDTIKNQGAIQFDFNEHIFTNTTVNVITDRLTMEDDFFMKAVAYPNPVEDVSTIMVADRFGQILPIPLKNVQVLTSTGVEVMRWNEVGEPQVTFAKKDLRPGTYIIKAQDIYDYIYIGRFIVK